MELITRSPDLKRLFDEGYEVQISEGHLIIHSVPYLNADKELAYGTMVTTLETSGDITAYQPGSDHTVYFSGSHPCDLEGYELNSIKHSSEQKLILPGVWVEHRFSARPNDNYRDYHHKMTTYIKILRAPLVEMGIGADARTYNRVMQEDASSFHFADTNGARAGITSINNKIAGQKVAIIGLGGTGSYVLDFVAKTPVAEIHLFDGDVLLSHNAFRAPGSPTIEQLRRMINKTVYHASNYKKMHRAIHAHPYNISESRVDELRGFDFVFLCMDGGKSKKNITQFLIDQSIPYVDVGLTVRNVDQKLHGQIRTTIVTPEHIKELEPYIPDVSDKSGNDVYESNAQIAELNALNACFAVIAWKRLNGIYEPFATPDHQVFKLRNNGIARYED